jgi:dipicolinate synthase subunit B
MGASLANIAALYNRKNYYFLPMLQDDPKKKPYSLVSCFELLPEALDAMREGRQLLPLFREIPEKG